MLQYWALFFKLLLIIIISNITGFTNYIYSSHFAMNVWVNMWKNQAVYFALNCRSNMPPTSKVGP